MKPVQLECWVGVTTVTLASWWLEFGGLKVDRAIDIDILKIAASGNFQA